MIEIIVNSGKFFILVVSLKNPKNWSLHTNWSAWLLGLWLLLFSAITSAEGFSIIINGFSHHVDPLPTQNFSEKNPGFGIQYDFAPVRDHWIPFVNASGFKDSLRNPSYYVGGGIMRRFSLTPKMGNLHLDAGLIAFLMTRQDYKDNDPFPGILPTASFGNDKIALNITYIPKVHPKIVPVWFFQLKIAFSNFK